MNHAPFDASYQYMFKLHIDTTTKKTFGEIVVSFDSIGAPTESISLTNGFDFTKIL